MYCKVSGWHESVQDLAQTGAVVSQHVHSVACTAGTLASAHGVATAGNRNPPMMAASPSKRASRASVDLMSHIISAVRWVDHHE